MLLVDNHMDATPNGEARNHQDGCVIAGRESVTSPSVSRLPTNPAEIAEVAQIMPLELAEQIVDITAPQNHEEMVEVSKIIP